MKRLIDFLAAAIEFLSIAGIVAFIAFCSDPEYVCGVYMSAPEAARNAYPCLFISCIVLFLVLLLVDFILWYRKMINDPYRQLEIIACNKTFDLAAETAKRLLMWELKSPVLVFIRWLASKTDNEFIQSLSSKSLNRAVVYKDYIDYYERLCRGIFDDEDGGDPVG